jgi:hypothetical protein
MNILLEYSNYENAMLLLRRIELNITMPAYFVQGFRAMSDSSRKIRLSRWSQWYGRARFGLFYHWGQRTGGGDSSSHSWGGRPYKHPTIEAFEAAAGEPADVAKNLVGYARTVGARYIIQTVYHTCDRFAVMYPTKVSAFRVKTRRDYIGAILDEAARRDIRVLLYVPESCDDHWKTPGGPWIDPKYGNDKAMAGVVHSIVRELVRRHGRKIAGFWLDGYYQKAGETFADRIHGLLPQAIVVHNNDTAFTRPGADVAAIECTTQPCDPSYCRPSGLRKPHPDWGTLPPGADFVEDIPTCNDWFYRDEPVVLRKLAKSPYVADPTFWVRQMASSLGQRRRWNYALGIGMRVDGSVPPVFAPMTRILHNFMRWASESIYDTLGGEGSHIEGGWWSDGAFGSVTVSMDDPSVYYLHVTTPPKLSRLRVPLRGAKAVSATHLRTGQKIPFVNFGYMEFPHLDCADTDKFGDTVIKVVVRK